RRADDPGRRRAAAPADPDRRGPAGLGLSRPPLPLAGPIGPARGRHSVCIWELRFAIRAALVSWRASSACALETTGVPTMMNSRMLRLSAPYGLALTLWLAPALARAQDGQLPVGPKVTAPEANDLDARPGPEPAPEPAAVSDVLPP